jgi:hypothetical protein
MSDQRGDDNNDDDERSMFMRGMFEGAASPTEALKADAALKEKVEAKRAESRATFWCWLFCPCVPPAVAIMMIIPVLLVVFILAISSPWPPLVCHDVTMSCTVSNSIHLTEHVFEKWVGLVDKLHGPIPVCQCPGCTVRFLEPSVWPLHTIATYQLRPGSALLPHELRAGMTRATSLQFIIDNLSWHLSAGHGSSEHGSSGSAIMLCMYEIKHGLPEDKHVCVMHRQDGGDQYIPMLNPELKGFAEAGPKEEGTIVVAERPLQCGGRLLARRRRLVVDVGFTTPYGHHIRLLLDREDEAMAFQLQWDQLRGMYNCSE